MKRQITDWEKILLNHISNKWFISEINTYTNNTYNSKIRKQLPNLKLGKISEHTHHQGGYTDGKWTYEKMLTIICH